TAFCQGCATKDDCSSLANQGCQNKRCMRDNTCLQHLGLEGVLAPGGLLGSLGSGAQGGGLGLYFVAGGYADVENGTDGLSLGMLGGGVPMPASSCVPTRMEPTGPTPAKAAAFTGNTAPNDKPFHVGAGLSKLELDTLGYSFYQTGGLCLAIGSAQVALLN